MRWKCPVCGHEQRGQTGSCAKCGSPALSQSGVDARMLVGVFAAGIVVLLFLLIALNYYNPVTRAYFKPYSVVFHSEATAADGPILLVGVITNHLDRVKTYTPAIVTQEIKEHGSQYVRVEVGYFAPGNVPARNSTGKRDVRMNMGIRVGEADAVFEWRQTDRSITTRTHSAMQMDEEGDMVTR